MITTLQGLLNDINLDISRIFNASSKLSTELSNEVAQLGKKMIKAEEIIKLLEKGQKQ